jgi:hypothetical protein
VSFNSAWSGCLSHHRLFEANETANHEKNLEAICQTMRMVACSDTSYITRGVHSESERNSGKSSINARGGNDNNAGGTDNHSREHIEANREPAVN